MEKKCKQEKIVVRKIKLQKIQQKTRTETALHCTTNKKKKKSHSYYYWEMSLFVFAKHMKS